MRNKGDSPPPETTQGWSAPRIFNPPDWVALTPAFGRYRSLVDEPNNLVANNIAATCFNRDVHEGLLELGLVAPDDGTYRAPNAAIRQELNIRVPLDYREGCSIEPYYEGRWYAWRSDLDRRTTMPETAPPPPQVRPEPLSEPEPARAESTRWQRDRTIEAIKALYPPDGIRPKGVSIAMLTDRINKRSEFKEDQVSEDTVGRALEDIKATLKK
jgi:hypothetical protein